MSKGTMTTKEKKELLTKRAVTLQKVLATRDGYKIKFINDAHRAAYEQAQVYLKALKALLRTITTDHSNKALVKRMIRDIEYDIVFNLPAVMKVEKVGHENLRAPRKAA